LFVLMNTRNGGYFFFLPVSRRPFFYILMKW
jgi:hypothetical protein